MGRVTPEDFRLMIAAHELGHALAWRAAGFRVLGIELSGRGLGTEGTTKLDPPHCPTEESKTGYLAGMLAGIEAGARWCDDHGIPAATHKAGCSWDRSAFRRNRKHLRMRHVPEATIRTQARQLVRSHWPQLVRLAPSLAERGRLAL